MSRPIFLAKVKTDTMSVYIFNDFQLTQIGANISGTAEAGTTISRANAVIQVKNQLFFNGGGVLYRYDKGLDTWVTVYTPASLLASGSRCVSGLHIFNINNQTNLCWIVNTSDTQHFKGIRYNLDTGATTETSSLALGIATVGRTYSVVFGGVIYWNMLGTLSSSGNPISFNPSANTITGNSVGNSTNNSNTDMCIYNMNLYIVQGNSAGTHWELWRLGGGGWVLIDGTTMAAPVSAAACQAVFLFTDRTNMYAILQKSGGNFACYQISPAMVITDISSTVLPTDFSASTATGGTRGWTYVNNEDDQNNPDIYIYIAFTATDGNVFGKWRWNGNNATMTQVGIGGDNSYAFTEDRVGAGDRSYSVGELDIVISSVTSSANIGAVKIAFNVFESTLIPSGTQCNVKMAFDADFEHPNRWAALSMPTPSGSIINGDTLTGIIVGSGINYTVDWKPGINGISPGQTVKIIPWVSGVTS